MLGISMCRISYTRSRRSYIRGFYHRLSPFVRFQQFYAGHPHPYSPFLHSAIRLPPCLRLFIPLHCMRHFLPILFTIFIYFSLSCSKTCTCGLFFVPLHANLRARHKTAHTSRPIHDVKLVTYWHKKAQSVARKHCKILSFCSYSLYSKSGKFHSENKHCKSSRQMAWIIRAYML